MDLSELGSAIKTARLNKGISQESLCSAVRMSRPTLSQIENGKVPEVGIRKVMEVLAQLGMELTLKDARRRPTFRELTQPAPQPAALAKAPTRQRAPRRKPDTGGQP